MNAVKIFGTRNATRVSLLPRRFKGATAIAADLARKRERESLGKELTVPRLSILGISSNFRSSFIRLVRIRLDLPRKFRETLGIS
jgi:hypothetical protein